MSESPHRSIASANLPSWLVGTLVAVAWAAFPSAFLFVGYWIQPQHREIGTFLAVVGTGALILAPFFSGLLHRSVGVGVLTLILLVLVALGMCVISPPMI